VKNFSIKERRLPSIDARQAFIPSSVVSSRHDTSQCFAITA
jgi:hypothetical protein